MRKRAADRLMYLNMLSRFLRKYGSNYPEEALEFIKNNFCSTTAMKDTADVLKQIYAFFGMLDPKENSYLAFSNMIGERYGWNSHILEIGGGFLPAFSYYVDSTQTANCTGGTITTYDPDLIFESLGNIHLHKETFTEEMTVDSYDVIVGIMPCEATKLIIRKATVSHKEFFIAMCGCIPKENAMFGYFLRDYVDYVQEVFDLAKEQEKDGFIVTMENPKQYSKYPIISSRRR